MEPLYFQQEEFRELPGHKQLWVSASGKVVSTRSNPPGKSNPPRLLIPWFDADGYMRIRAKSRFYNEKRSGYVQVHQAVLLAWGHERPSQEHQVRHLNGDKNDNRLANLAWGTLRENLDDKIRHGTVAKGSKNGSARLTEGQVLAFREEAQHKPMWEIVKSHPQYSKFALWACISGYSWAHLPGAITGKRKCTKNGWRNGVKLRVQTKEIPDGGSSQSITE
jgi:hypothetical protein